MAGDLSCAFGICGLDCSIRLAKQLESQVFEVACHFASQAMWFWIRPIRAPEQILAGFGWRPQPTVRRSASMLSKLRFLRNNLTQRLQLHWLSVCALGASGFHLTLTGLELHLLQGCCDTDVHLDQHIKAQTLHWSRRPVDSPPRDNWH